MCWKRKDLRPTLVINECEVPTSRNTSSLSRWIINGSPISVHTWTDINLSNNPSRGLTYNMNLGCSNSFDKVKKGKIHTYKIIFLVILKTFEQLFPGRSRKDIFLSTNLWRRIFASPACVLFIVNTHALLYKRRNPLKSCDGYIYGL